MPSPISYAVFCLKIKKRQTYYDNLHTYQVRAYFMQRYYDVFYSFFVIMSYHAHRRTLFPYTTLFRSQILKQNAKREMRLRLGKVTVADVLAAQPVTTKRRLQRSESGSEGMPRPISYAVFCLKKKKLNHRRAQQNVMELL